MIDYALYNRVMEFLANYLGLRNKSLCMSVLHYNEVLNGVKMLIAIYQVDTGELITYCVVKFDNVMNRAEPLCNEDRKYIERIYEEVL
jgi:hypothetical protein